MISAIPYDKILVDFPPTANSLIDSKLISILEDVWLDRYRKASSHETNVLQFQDSGFIFLYDQTSSGNSGVEDRLVVGYGFSVHQDEKRDASRIRGLLGGGLEIPGKGTFDKGHVLAHSMGGGTSVNLFPQRPELNQPRSEKGKLYCRMERFAARNPNTFVFSRLWYSDDSWVPSAMEYGVLLPERRFWVEQFKN
jgi:hypothetical protein